MYFSQPTNGRVKTAQQLDAASGTREQGVKVLRISKSILSEFKRRNSHAIPMQSRYPRICQDHQEDLGIKLYMEGRGRKILRFTASFSLDPLPLQRKYLNLSSYRSSYCRKISSRKSLAKRVYSNQLSWPAEDHVKIAHVFGRAVI